MHLSTRRWAARIIVAIVVAACTQAAPAGAEAAPGVLVAYENQAANPNRSFHLLQTGTFSAGGQTGDVHYELDASGDNASGVLKVGGETIEIRLIDRNFFANVGRGWQTLPYDADIAHDIFDFFRYVGDSANLRFVERVEEAGAAVFHFRAIDPVPYQTSEMRSLGVTGSIPDLDFFVRHDGIPVRFTFRSTAQQGNTTIEARTTVEISRWGEPVAIEAPP